MVKPWSYFFTVQCLMILRLVHYSFPPFLRTIHNIVTDGEDAGDSLAAYRNYSGRVYYYIAKTGGGGGRSGIDQGGEEDGRGGGGQKQH